MDLKKKANLNEGEVFGNFFLRVFNGNKFIKINHHEVASIIVIKMLSLAASPVLAFWLSLCECK